MIRACLAGLTLGGLALAATPAAMAQTALMERYDEAVIRKIVKEIGFGVSNYEIADDGEPTMTVEPPSDLPFLIDGMFCEGSDADKHKSCTGLQMAAIVGDVDGKQDLKAIAEKFNRGYRPAKLFVTDRGLVLERYLILDGGISEHNLKTNIEVFADMLKAIWDDLDA